MIGCVIAMESEAEYLRGQMQIEDTCRLFGKTVYRGKAFGRELLLTVCGEGKVNAATGACAVLGAGADVLLNFGVAGGLDPRSTEVGGVYLIHKVVQYDFDLSQLNGLPVGTLPGKKENFLPLFYPCALEFPRRALGTGDRFNDSPIDHALLLSLGCEIREMEAGAIAQVAMSAKIPFISVKAISDVYGSGSTTDQFQKNLRFAMSNLEAQLCKIIGSL